MKHVFSFLQESAQKHPQKVYVVDKETEWTYFDIYHKATTLAKHMNNYHINSGDRVLIYLDNSVEYIIAFFSVLLMNAIVVPINKNTTVDNLKFIVEDTSPKMILSSEAFLGRLQNKVNFGTCQSVKIDLIADDYDYDYSGNDTNFIDQLTSEGDLTAMILYTSGTTRMPKGVTLTHKNLIANTESILEYLELTPEDSILATINFSYSYGNSVFLTHTKVGGTIIIENRIAYPAKVIEAMCESKATGFSTVGSYINLLLKQQGLENAHLKYLRYITFAGESTSTQDIMKLNNIAPHIKIYVMYGQTEASARLSYLEPSMLFKKAGSIGKGIPGVNLRVIMEDGSDACPDQIGEIIGFGPNIMKGYWNNESETKSVIKDGWLYTGDLATVDEDGYIYIKGRKDDIIKYLGHRISPLEIEAAINSCDQVLESAVIAVENEHGKQIKAYIIPKYNAYEIDEIKAYLRKLLPPFKRPQVIEVTNEIPRTVNGKIKRSDLRNINL